MMNVIYPIIVFLVGLAVGSFLNVVILRLPREESLFGRSHCMNCKRELSAIDLFPIFSFLFLKGKCRTCGTKISWRYAGIELLTASLFLFAYLFYLPADLIGWLWFIKFAIFTSTLIAVFFIDLEHYLIFDSVLLWGGAGVVAINLGLDFALKNQVLSLNNTFGGLLAALIISAPLFCFWYFSKGKWMGFGDVKLALLLGLGLGFPNAILGWFLAFLIGSLWSVPMLVFGSKSLKSKLPFGTFLSVAALITWFWGSSFLVWYLAILGL